MSTDVSAIAKAWPYAQRVSWSSDMTEADMRLLRQRIVEGLVLSARGIDHEELRRLRVRHRWLGALAVAVLAWHLDCSLPSDRRRRHERMPSGTCTPSMGLLSARFSNSSLKRTTQPRSRGSMRFQSGFAAGNGATYVVL